MFRRGRESPASVRLREISTLVVALFASSLVLAPGTRADDDSSLAQGLSFGFGDGPRFLVHGFADLGYRTEHDEGPAGEVDSRNEFYLGEFDLYLVSRLSQGLSLLAEVTLEVDDDGNTEIDLERLFVKYRRSDHVWVSLGRRHLPLGFWNETFHHGLIMQPTIHRPEILRFEDRGGVLPVHATGVLAGGRMFRGRWALDYVGGLSNGRGPSLDQPQSVGDANGHKAPSVKLGLSWDGDGSHVGFGGIGYGDRIPPELDVPGRDSSLDETILGLFAVLRTTKVDLFGEYFDIRHEDRSDGRRFDSSGYYALVVWRQWRWKPYLGIDRVDLDPLDPYFASREPELDRVMAGARFDLNPFCAVKFELRHDDRQEHEIDALEVQVAFTF